MLKNKQSYLLLLIFILSFILIAFKGLKTPQPGDENVYYYMGKLVSEGKIPYKDFFFAHPPLHIYLIALVYKISGFSIAALKLIPLISAIITAFFIFQTARKFGNFEAVAASLLFLSSYSVMFNSVFSFGIELAMMFLIIGIYFLFNRNNYWIAGLFFGLAGITRLLSLIPTAIILILIFFSNKKNFLKLSLGFLMIFLLVNGIFFLLAGSSYFSYAYGYHLQKTFGGKENFREYLDILKLNWLLFFSAFLFAFAKGRKQLVLFASVALAYLIFLITLKKIFGFYFLIAFPFLAIFGGYSIANLAGTLSKKLKIAALLILALLFVWNLSSDIIFLEKIGFRGFERGKDLADFAALNSNEETMLFGDASVAPLLALQTNKDIALDFVDTNDQVFTSGIKDINMTLGSMVDMDILFIVRDRQGISYFREVREFLSKNCEFLSQFHDKMEGNYLVYRCN